MRRPSNILIYAYFACGLLYALLSYGLVDPNLVLINHPIYWQFQTWMWQTFYHNSLLLTQMYLLVTTAWFVIFIFLVVMLRRQGQASAFFQPKILGCYLIMIFPLFFAYNALSHDVFNYIFNAKMVIVYGVDPHQEVALSYADDDWTRFMHNTHTPAPYGYGWTALSLLPFVVGGGKFITTWLAFRLFNVVSLGSIWWLIHRAARSWTGKPIPLWRLALFFLNPLVVIEVLGNVHNDLWMMAPALVSLAIISELKILNRRAIWPLLIGIGLFIFSVSIKFATLALLPVMIVIFLEKTVLTNIIQRSQIGRWPSVSEKLRTILTDWFDRKLLAKLPLFASVLMFLPLLTVRSQQFHPWYLLWSLVWLPFMKLDRWSQLLMVFSLSSLWRYSPWILAGNFEGQVLWLQRLITWFPASLYLLYMFYKKSPPPRIISKNLKIQNR